MLKDLCFEIIQTCPNHCLFCSSVAGMDKHKTIDYDLFKRTIDYFMSIGRIEEISLSGGEPLLHPELLRMIRYCKLNNIKENEKQIKTYDKIKNLCNVWNNLEFKEKRNIIETLLDKIVVDGKLLKIYWNVS